MLILKIIIFTIVPFCKSFLILEQYSNNICPHSIYITITLIPFPLKVLVASIKIIIFTLVLFCKFFLIFKHSNNIWYKIGRWRYQSSPYSIYITETLIPFPFKVLVAYYWNYNFYYCTILEIFSHTRTIFKQYLSTFYLYYTCFYTISIKTSSCLLLKL